MWLILEVASSGQCPEEFFTLYNKIWQFMPPTLCTHIHTITQAWKYDCFAIVSLILIISPNAERWQIKYRICYLPSTLWWWSYVFMILAFIVHIAHKILQKVESTSAGHCPRFEITWKIHVPWSGTPSLEYCPCVWCEFITVNSKFLCWGATRIDNGLKMSFLIHMQPPNVFRNVCRWIISYRLV